MSTHDLAQRRACRLVGVDPKTVRRERAPDHPEIRARMRAIAGERRRFGYRRIGLMLEREGTVMNHNKLRRLYREEPLSVRRRKGRKRAADAGSRRSRATPVARLPVGCLRGRPALPLPVRDRRSHAGVTGAGRRHVDPGPTDRPGARCRRPALRQTAEHRQRQRQRTDRPSHARVAEPDLRDLALHRAGQAPAEYLHRELQRETAR